MSIDSLVPDAPGAPPGTLPPVTWERVLTAVSLLVPIVALLWVSSYSRLTPRLLGLPFFYWYQILWIPLSALFTTSAYLLMNRDARRRRAARGGGAR
ncbi:hypothetical protein GCM10009665_20400 [Kitasatospora nipponensis]|uniref:DUF3311 domain-containing protein n=1 Tax=Kitasatospora nipponensis TaxID=258049 RepID=A0ABP4GS81_9ACTN